MKKLRILAGNRCPECGCVALDQPQHLAKAWLSGIFHALRLVFDKAALLSVPVAAASSLLCPASARAQGGVPLWTNRYDGQANGDHYAIAVDSSGNVFITGYAWNATGNNEDYATIKYSNAGLALWTNRYDGPANSNERPSAIAVDRSGNVFVTGESWNGNDPSSSPDYATIAYSNSGVPLWTNRYDGPGNNYDLATAIAVDSSGNVFVTGYSRSGSDSLSDDYATIAYSNAGMPLWTNRYDGANSLDRPSAIAVDASGNVFVTGRSYDGPTFSDPAGFATVAYSNAGVPLWTNRYNGAGNSWDVATAIVVDSSGNVFVTGSSVGIGTSDDYATIKYSNAGVPLWTNRYNAPGNSFDEASAIAVDTSGNVFVTGYSNGGGSFADYATIKYSNAGVPLWTRRYNGPGNTDDYATALAVDSSGNVFVTGRSENGANNDFATIANSSAGVQLWTRRYNGPANVDDRASAIAVDRSGNVFVTGASFDGTNSDFVTIKYSSSIPLPRLDFHLLSNQLVLSWTNAGFNLQAAPALTGPFTNLPAATSPYTNPLTAPQQFFRLNAN